VRREGGCRRRLVAQFCATVSHWWDRSAPFFEAAPVSGQNLFLVTDTAPIRADIGCATAPVQAGLFGVQCRAPPGSGGTQFPELLSDRPPAPAIWTTSVDRTIGRRLMRGIAAAERVRTAVAGRLQPGTRIRAPTKPCPSRNSPRILRIPLDPMPNALVVRPLAGWTVLSHNWCGAPGELVVRLRL